MYNVGDKLIVTATENIRNWNYGDILVIVEVDKEDLSHTYRCSLVDGGVMNLWTRTDQVTLYESNKTIEGADVDKDKVQIGDVIKSKEHNTIFLVSHIYKANVKTIGLTEQYSKQEYDIFKTQLSNYIHIHNISDIYSSIDI